MAKRRYTFDKAGKPQVPFFCEYGLSDFDNDKEAFSDYLDTVADEYEKIQRRLKPGEPHPLHYEHEWEDPAYQSDMRIFESVEAQEIVRARHDRKPQAPPMTKEQRAFFHGSGDDKKEAQERLEMRRFIDEQLQDAVEHRAGGRIDKAKACEQRAEQWTRSLRKRERNPYSFEAAEETHAVQWGEGELDKMVKASAEELAERFDEIKGMVEGFRQMSPSEYSYTLTGSGPSLRLSKVKHPGIPARELAARVGDISDENLLIKMAAHGVETREEAGPPKEEPKKSMGEMSMGDYREYVEKQEAEAREKAAGDKGPTVAPGMFGG